MVNRDLFVNRDDSSTRVILKYSYARFGLYQSEIRVCCASQRDRQIPSTF